MKTEHTRILNLNWPLRHALITASSTGATLIDRRLKPGPVADASLLLTW